MTLTSFPFEADFEDIQSHPEPYVTSVFASLESEFLVLPKGHGFVEYPVFENAYEALKKATTGFRNLTPDRIYPLLQEFPIVIIVLRAMLGFTPPEWAYVATQRSDLDISQGFVRSMDRKVRMNPDAPIRLSGMSEKRLIKLIEVACDLLCQRPPEVSESQIHRLDKADTRFGRQSLETMAEMGAPYSMLLYERFLGRPFAGHRDSVSEIIGSGLESAVEKVLHDAGISFRKTKRAERLEGFDQAPDFIVPSEFNPKVIIEAKITEDDGTARDKVTRIQHLGELSTAGLPEGEQRYEVIACIGGRGFGIRREDMRKMLLATRGKVFTLKTLPQMVVHTRLRHFRSDDGGAALPTTQRDC